MRLWFSSQASWSLLRLSRLGDGDTEYGKERGKQSKQAEAWESIGTTDKIRERAQTMTMTDDRSSIDAFPVHVPLR